jgi:tryptophan 2,3-dioxygenase
MSFGLPQDEAKLSYGSYLHVDDLIGLQKLLSDPPRHDELLFIVIHQVYELWFKQLLHELQAIVGRLEAGEPLGAQRLLRRCIEIERVLIQQLTVLETMTPNDFLTFRDHLMPASGFQSIQFRSLEKLCGSQLFEVFLDLMRGRGFTLPAGAEEEQRLARVRELVRIYQEPDRNYDLYLLCEAMVEFDEQFMLWRVHHVQMVERMIGSKPGTGGSPGVSYLRSTLDRKFFPELWELRTYLSDKASY